MMTLHDFNFISNSTQGEDNTSKPETVELTQGPTVNTCSQALDSNCCSSEHIQHGNIEQDTVPSQYNETGQLQPSFRHHDDELLYTLNDMPGYEFCNSLIPQMDPSTAATSTQGLSYRFSNRRLLQANHHAVFTPPLANDSDIASDWTGIGIKSMNNHSSGNPYSEPVSQVHYVPDSGSMADYSFGSNFNERNWSLNSDVYVTPNQSLNYDFRNLR